MDKWHRISFKIKWDRESPAKFFIDLIIIDLLIAPTIKKFKSRFDLWTFHRSASSKDENGHMLKFNFYSNQETAEEILNYIKSHEDFNCIKNYLEETEVKLRDIGTEIEAISSGIKASQEILKSWPYYIMGACEMYINLIKETKSKKSNEISKNNSKQLENYYKEVHEDINKQWYDGGQHAFFHHLWAIFGYTKTQLNLIAGTIHPKIMQLREKIHPCVNIPDIFWI